MSFVGNAVGKVIGGITGANQAAKGAQAAADTQSAASREANQLQREMWERQLKDQQPWLDVGKQNLNRLAQMMQPGGEFNRNFTMADYQADPGFQFRQQQGEQAINRAASAAGRYDSGRALKDLTEFNSGLASQEFGNAFNRWDLQQGNRYNRLANLAGVGQTANQQLQQAGQNYANQASQNLANIGSAQGAAQIAKGNVVGNSFDGAMKLGGAIAGYFSDRRLKRNIQQIGTAVNGLPLYIFQYIWGDDLIMGHMADEVQAKYPEFVSQTEDGFMVVNYGGLYGNN